MWEKKPVLFLILATAAILVGTIITMVLPFAWVNTEKDKIVSVIPYSPLQLAGRDVYIREGCNNCHTQTVRPLVADVLRYGEYSKSGEFLYDQPHLWGSRRTGPDLARLGGKYPDEWHYKHMRNPKAFVPLSNMPGYGFLDNKQLDPAYIEKKMKVLNFPYTSEDIQSLTGKNEMDAIVAYMQKLGSDIPWQETAAPTIVGELKNPFMGDAAAIAAGKTLYTDNCSACHGTNMEGDIGPELDGPGYDETELFEIIYGGIPDGGMPPYAKLGATKIWQMVNYLQKGN